MVIPRSPQLPQSPYIENSLKITADWGYRGQGSTVMPGQGLSPERSWSATELEKISALAATQSLTLEDTITLLGETCVDVHLNSESFWSAIPMNVVITPSAATRSSRSGSAIVNSRSSVAHFTLKKLHTSPKSSAESPPSFS